MRNTFRLKVSAIFAGSRISLPAPCASPGVGKFATSLLICKDALLDPFLWGLTSSRKEPPLCKATSYLNSELVAFILGPTQQLPEPLDAYIASIAVNGLCNLCGSLLQ